MQDVTQRMATGWNCSRKIETEAQLPSHVARTGVVLALIVDSATRGPHTWVRVTQVDAVGYGQTGLCSCACLKTRIMESKLPRWRNGEGDYCFGLSEEV